MPKNRPKIWKSVAKIFGGSHICQKIILAMFFHLKFNGMSEILYDINNLIKYYYFWLLSLLIVECARVAEWHYINIFLIWVLWRHCFQGKSAIKQAHERKSFWMKCFLRIVHWEVSRPIVRQKPRRNHGGRIWHRVGG